MANKTKKDYTIKVADGRFTLSLNNVSADGRKHSVSVPYPFVSMGADGKMKKMTRKQTENWCLEVLREQGILAAADGNK